MPPHMLSRCLLPIALLCLIGSCEGFTVALSTSRRSPACGRGTVLRLQLSGSNRNDDDDDVDTEADLAYFRDSDFQGSPRSLQGGAKVIDVILRTWSWAFLPLIFLTGLSLAALTRPTNEPLRIGAPSPARLEAERLRRDPLRLSEQHQGGRSDPSHHDARTSAAFPP